MSPPDYARRGAPISAAQHEMLERLESLLDHFVDAPDLKLGDLGRASEKLGNLSKASFQLGSLFGMDDLQSFLKVVSQDLDPYSTPKQTHETQPSKQKHTCGSSSTSSMSNARSGTDVPPFAADSEVVAGTGYRVPLATTSTKQIQADRIKWKLGPSFDPVPFLPDPIVRAAFQNPEVLRKPAAEWPSRPRALVHCSRQELLKLAEKWDALGSCTMVRCEQIQPDEPVGLFAVPKDETYDRLIVNPTVINSRQYSYSNYTKTLAPGALIGLLRLDNSENLVISTDDLSEFYYTFRVTPERASRNAIGIPFKGHELQHLLCYKPELQDQDVFLCLATLAMGDGLAVEIAQQSHYTVLQSLAGCMRDDEVIAYRKVIPKGPFYELLTIDDHIGLQRVQKDIPLDKQNTRDKEVFEQATRAYEQVGLVSHPGKRQRQVKSAVVLGAEVDGELGRVSAPRSRIALLMFITGVIVSKQLCTRRLLQSVLGCWIHVCLFRRPVFSVLDMVFHEGQDCHPDEVFKLSQQSMNELLTLMVLGPLIQSDLRTGICPELFVMDASPTGGAVCRSQMTSCAIEELWRHSEQRGYYTKLQQGANLILHEHGLDQTDPFGAGSLDLAALKPEAVMSISESLPSKPMFDCIELFAGQGNWSAAHSAAGLRVHPGLDRASRGVHFADLADDDTFRDLARLAESGQVREWHAGPPCWSFGTLRRPRLRSKDCPAGFAPSDETTWGQTKLAIRTAFILILALLSGSYVSCEQPGSSVMFRLHIFQVLRQLGCTITRFCFCSFGSGFNKPSQWLHNKPWMLGLSGTCTCQFKGQHFIIEGSFTEAAIRQFDRRCVPSCEAVYGRRPRRGEAVSAFSASYPIPLCNKLAQGSVAARSGSGETQCGRLVEEAPFEPTAAEKPGLRPWHEDPDWVEDLCKTLEFRELFRYRFKKSGHINVLERRVYKSWLKHCAKRWSGHRMLGLLDSRVTMGASAKGRSSSKALSRVLRTSLSYILGGGLYPGCLHCRSSWNSADGPSRDGCVPPPEGPKAGWISALEAGDSAPFEMLVAAARWTRPLGRWVRLLLLLAGDVERNPGPGVAFGGYEPRGELDMFGGLSQATSARMQLCLDGFALWLSEFGQMTLEDALVTAESCNLSLSTYGKWLFSEGQPRYKLVYAITAVQRLRPQFRGHLGLAWHVDRMWQLEQPGQCRAVISGPMLRAVLTLSLLWRWYRFAGLVALGYAAMLHPNEFLHLTRKDVVFPEDSLFNSAAMFIHIQSPKTARFARRQHARIDDDSVILLCRCMFFKLKLDERLYPGTMAMFRRQWNHLFDFLGIPRRQLLRGATPGTLRGSGATQLYIDSEDLQKIAWRGRWARMRTLEHYVQEVGAQLFLYELSSAARDKVRFLEKHCMTVLAAEFPSIVFAKQNFKDG